MALLTQIAASVPVPTIKNTKGVISSVANKLLQPVSATVVPFPSRVPPYVASVNGAIFVTARAIPMLGGSSCFTWN